MKDSHVNNGDDVSVFYCAAFAAWCTVHHEAVHGG